MVRLRACGFFSGEYDAALLYVNKALKLDASGKNVYGYLKGHILAAQKKNNEAITQLELTYKQIPENITAEDILLLIRLYSESAKHKSAISLIELYFQKGIYYPGFGMFSSGVYEAAGDYAKSILCAYLDIEYYKGMLGINNDEFLNNMDGIESTLKQNGHYSEAEPDIQLLRGMNNQTTQIPISQQGIFFVPDYLVLEKKIRLSSVHESDIQSYLAYENFFKHSPLYYMYAWQAFVTLSPSTASNYTPILEKIIALKPEKNLDAAVRNIIGTQLGLTESQSARLLMPFEVSEILETFSTSRNAKQLDRVFQLFELSDNAYVISALMLLKSQKDTLQLRDILTEKQKGVSVRAKERIAFVLH